MHLKADHQGIGDHEILAVSNNQMMQMDQRP